MEPLSERLSKMTPLQRAVFALKETQNRLDALERSRTEPIAIVGMACRFPGGATNPQSFWRLLSRGVDAIGEIPASRWNADDFYDPDPAAPGKMNSRRGGFLQRIEEFDNHFFGISDAEAARIDPQQRMLLELAWETLEDAGLPPNKLRGTRTGVFIGISVSEYGLMLSSDLGLTNAHAAAGTSLCLAANRLSFAFGLQGPSVALDTACSSSLVAVHLACQSIRNGECEAALVGGANLLLSPIGTVNLTKAGFCAADGRVRAFDAAASGYVRSEGVGLVLLRPLAAALANNDPIYAVIRGSAINQNGASNGLTAPSRAAQEQVLREAYQRSGVSPGQVGFVETQGTGTRLGDVIEATALGNVMGQGRAPGSRCTLGAVKTNIGHLEAASGIASLIKTALVLEHGALPPNLHFQSANPDIPFETLPLKVQRGLEPWAKGLQPRFAGVSAFGFGGSNAHVVLEESPDRVISTDNAPGLHLLPLSARTEQALMDLAANYRTFLTETSPAWNDVCYTAAIRRQHHDWRVAVLAGSPEQAAESLAGFASGESRPGVFQGRKPFGRRLNIAFVFDDAGQDWQHCAPQLAQAAQGWTAATEEIDLACQRVLGWSMASIADADARWNDPAWAREAAFALQLALAAWWRSAGITPDLATGRGVGEFAAAATAGILTIEEALRLLSNNRSPAGAGLTNFRGRRAALPFLSSVDGQLHSGSDLDIAHWQKCFGTKALVAAPAVSYQQVDVRLQIGPATRSGPLNGHAHENPASKEVIPSLHGGKGGGVDLQSALGALYSLGAELLWERIAPPGRCVRTPTYAWQRQWLWAPSRNNALTSRTPPASGDNLQSTAGAEPTESSLPGIRKRPELTAPLVGPRTPLEAALVRCWTGILRIEEIGIHDNFFELGGDSLQATSLLNRLHDEIGQAVPGHALFQVQTIQELAEYLRRECGSAVRQKFPDEAAALAGNLSAGASKGRVPAGLVSLTASASIPRLARNHDAAELLARLDDLPDDEVEALLGKAMADGEARYD